MSRRAGVGTKEHLEHLEWAQREAPIFDWVVWYREPHLRKLYAWAAVLMLASATTGFDGMLVNTSQQIDRWKADFPETQPGSGLSQDVTDSWLGLVVNIFNIGSIVSFFITPFVTDHWGRKPAIAIGCAFMITGAAICAFCSTFPVYLVGRFLLGFGNSLSQMASPLLLIEICHPQHRGPVTAVYNCLWNLGALLVACAGWGTSGIRGAWSWRSITLLQALPSLVQIAFVYWIPESPRYLLSRGRPREALAVLAKHHAGGNARNATVQFEFREIRETMRLEREAAASSGYLDFVRGGRGNRWRLAILVSLGVISQYSGNALFSNYMDTVYSGAGVQDQNRKLALSAGKTFLDLIVTITAALEVDRFGRRPLFLLSTGGMVACCALWTLFGALYEGSPAAPGLPASAGLGYAQLVFIWLFGVFYDIGFTGLLIAYALEILPYRLRAKGMMIMNVVLQAVLALSNQTNKLAWSRLPKHWNLMLFYTIWNLCELVFVYLFYVETKGPTLEEMARIFDGGDAAPVARVDLRQVEKDVRSVAVPDHDRHFGASSPPDCHHRHHHYRHQQCGEDYDGGDHHQQQQRGVVLGGRGGAGGRGGGGGGGVARWAVQGRGTDPVAGEVGRPFVRL